MYFKSYFSSFHLWEKLNELNISGTDTITVSRISYLKQVNADKMFHGTCIEHVTPDKKIIVVE